MLWRVRNSRGRPKNAPAGFIQPCRPTVAQRPPRGESWVHELKHDGYAYFAFTDDVLTRLIGNQQNTNQDHIFELRAQIDRQYFDQKQVEQQLTALLQRQETLEQRTSGLTSDLSATGTIKQESITPPEATPAEKPTPASPINDTAIFFAPPEREVRLQSPELPASATTKHHRIYRAAHHRALLRHRVAPPKATPAEQSPQLTSAITKPERGIADQ
jgi:hypothetical protein